MEHFYTIQGEGAKSGTAAYFIRLAGCDVGCVWCDVKESWEIHQDQYVTLDEIVGWVEEASCHWIVITGGEPAMYDLNTLTKRLRNLGKKIAIETSGAYPLRGHFDWVCLSPKKFKSPDSSNWNLVDEFKLVIFHPSDFMWGLELAKNVPDTAQKFVQPEWGKQSTMKDRVVDFVKENPDWRVSLQTHKFLELP